MCPRQSPDKEKGTGPIGPIPFLGIPVIAFLPQETNFFGREIAFRSRLVPYIFFTAALSRRAACAPSAHGVPGLRCSGSQSDGLLVV